MKLRIRLSKHGAMKFIGHLDMMRYFQKALRRADIDISFSEGFSPHMIMSFALPLGVGMTSDSEYVDIEVGMPLSSAETVKRLNAVMAEGVTVRSCRRIDDGKASKAMSLVAAADYTVRLRDAGILPEGWEEKLPEFLAQEEIVVLKKTKKGEKEADIRPMILQMQARDGAVFMRLFAGSAANLKPEPVMQAFASFLGCELPKFALLVNRDELYAASEDTPEGFVTLEALGEEIIG